MNALTVQHLRLVRFEAELGVGEMKAVRSQLHPCTWWRCCPNKLAGCPGFVALVEFGKRQKNTVRQVQASIVGWNLGRRCVHSISITYFRHREELYRVTPEASRIFNSQDLGCVPECQVSALTTLPFANSHRFRGKLSMSGDPICIHHPKCPRFLANNIKKPISQDRLIPPASGISNTSSI